MNKIKRLIVVGDSWTYGSEIKDPTLLDTVNDWDSPNDAYRIPRIWSSKLGAHLGTHDVVNLSYPGASNDQIMRNIVGWLTENYLHPKQSTEDIFVVVGLTSPERKDFYYKDSSHGFWFTVWPMWGHNYQQENISKFAKMYIDYFYNHEESTHRYLNQIFYLQNLFKQHHIKFLFFQSFYQVKDLHIRQWRDEPYARHYVGQVDSLIWDMIDPVTFMHKNDEIQSFHNYIMKKDPEKALALMHPSEIAHTWWADHVYEYCKENNLC